MFPRLANNRVLLARLGSIVAHRRQDILDGRKGANLHKKGEAQKLAAAAAAAAIQRADPAHDTFLPYAAGFGFDTSGCLYVPELSDLVSNGERLRYSRSGNVADAVTCPLCQEKTTVKNYEQWK